MSRIRRKSAVAVVESVAKREKRPNNSTPPQPQNPHLQKMGLSNEKEKGAKERIIRASEVQARGIELLLMDAFAKRRRPYWQIVGVSSLGEPLHPYAETRSASCKPNLLR